MRPSTRIGAATAPFQTGTACVLGGRALEPRIVIDPRRPARAGDFRDGARACEAKHHSDRNEVVHAITPAPDADPDGAVVLVEAEDSRRLCVEYSAGLGRDGIEHLRRGQAGRDEDRHPPQRSLLLDRISQLLL